MKSIHYFTFMLTFIMVDVQAMDQNKNLSAANKQDSFIPSKCNTLDADIKEEVFLAFADDIHSIKTALSSQSKKRGSSEFYDALASMLQNQTAETYQGPLYSSTIIQHLIQSKKTSNDQAKIVAALSAIKPSCEKEHITKTIQTVISQRIADLKSKWRGGDFNEEIADRNVEKNPDFYAKEVIFEEMTEYLEKHTKNGKKYNPDVNNKLIEEQRKDGNKPWWLDSRSSNNNKDTQQMSVEPLSPPLKKQINNKNSSAHYTGRFIK